MVIVVFLLICCDYWDLIGKQFNCSAISRNSPTSRLCLRAGGKHMRSFSDTLLLQSCKSGLSQIDWHSG
uniref:Transcription initiation factor TFIID subunit 12b-like isoform X2 n=1 Tax=Rhizophora mucronata TaxID=61149 RepID=A0A2P2N6F4_RHIMU